MKRLPARCGALLICLAILVASASSLPAQTPPAPPPGGLELSGRWVGSKLRCQKEEGKLVRCGMPAPFEIDFLAEGTGTTPDENLPKQFTWRRISPQEVGITPAAGGEELKLFGIESDEGSLTFQAYIFLPVADPNAPPEARYVHFIFDVTRTP